MHAKQLGTHFHHQDAAYQHSVTTSNNQWYQNMRRALSPLVRGTVIDIGNGGVFNYDTAQAEKIIAVDISFIEPPSSNPENITFLQNDARTLKDIPSNTADLVIFQLMLHHVVGENFTQTKHYFHQSLQAAHRVLKPGGSIAVLEVCSSRILAYLQQATYPLNWRLTQTLGKPMVYMYRVKTIQNALQSNDFQTINATPVSYGGKVDILNGVKPNLLVVPGWLSPTRCHLITAKKPQNN